MKKSSCCCFFYWFIYLYCLTVQEIYTCLLSCRGSVAGLLANYIFHLSKGARAISYMHNLLDICCHASNTAKFISDLTTKISNLDEFLLVWLNIFFEVESSKATDPNYIILAMLLKSSHCTKNKVFHWGFLQ